MEQPNDGDADDDDFDNMCDFMEEAYGNAFGALQAGVTKESLVSQIDQAFECLEQMKMDGSLVGFVERCSRADDLPT